MNDPLLNQPNVQSVSLSWENAILTHKGFPLSVRCDPLGTIVRELRQELQRTEYSQSKIIAAAGHDTQCAIAALPSNARILRFYPAEPGHYSALNLIHRS